MLLIELVDTAGCDVVQVVTHKNVQRGQRSLQDPVRHRLAIARNQLLRQRSLKLITHPVSVPI